MLQRRKSPNRLLLATAKTQKNGKFKRGCWDGQGEGSEREKTLDAEIDIELAVRTSSGKMAFIPGGLVGRNWSDDGGLASAAHVWTNAQPSSGSVRAFEKLLHSVFIVQERLQSPGLTDWKAETTESAQDAFAESMQRYSDAHQKEVSAAGAACEFR